MAAVYQLTPLKDVCLRHCRSPFMFLMKHWRPGRLGALRMGVIHGGWCVGCCWALMAALFALGVMSLGWMAFIAALIAIEKLLPWRALANRGIAVLLLVLGLGVAFAPESVPGLTLPGSPKAMRAMEAMGMDEGSMDQGGSKGMQGDSMDQGGSTGMKGDSMGKGGLDGHAAATRWATADPAAMHDDSMGNAGSGGKMSRSRSRCGNSAHVLVERSLG